MLLSATLIAALASTSSASLSGKRTNSTASRLNRRGLSLQNGCECPPVNLPLVQASVGGVWCHDGGIDYEKNPGGWCFYDVKCPEGLCHDANEEAIANDVYYCRNSADDAAGQLYYANGDAEPAGFLEPGLYCAVFTGADSGESGGSPTSSPSSAPCGADACDLINLPLVSPTSQGVWCNSAGGVSYEAPEDLSQFCFQSTNCGEGVCHDANTDHVVNGVYYCKKNEPGLGQIYYRGDDAEPAGFLEDFCTVFVTP